MSLPKDSLPSFQAVRQRAAKFVSDRDWQQYHTPTNVCLALTGECGEVSEIFQWKGALDNGVDDDKFTSKEVIHIGEEVSDVFIYSTRLCDLCNIDLAYCARHAATHPNPGNPSDEFLSKVQHSGGWDNITFRELEGLLPKDFVSEVKSPRRVAMLISAKVGLVCDLFQVKSEAQNLVGLPGWSRMEVAKLGYLMGSIAILLLRMAIMARTGLDHCVAEKFEKNEKKYPAEMVKGSSAKYTGNKSLSTAIQQSHAIIFFNSSLL